MATEDDIGDDTDALTHSIDLEIAARRAEWQHKREKFRSLRLLSFSILSLIIVGAVVALFVIFSRLNEARDHYRTTSPSPTSSPQSPPR